MRVDARILSLNVPSVMRCLGEIQSWRVMYSWTNVLTGNKVSCFVFCWLCLVCTLNGGDPLIPLNSQWWWVRICVRSILSWTHSPPQITFHPCRMSGKGKVLTNRCKWDFLADGPRDDWAFDELSDWWRHIVSLSRYVPFWHRLYLDSIPSIRHTM